MERQYIGARYVPKFFENPNTTDSAWLAGVAYEALTIVTYAGNSYTSKKPVPAGIGAPNENPDYWVSTGIYNVQVETLRQQILAVDDRVDDANDDIVALDNKYGAKFPVVPANIAHKQYILIADSFGNPTTVGGNPWIHWFEQLAGVTEGETAFSRYSGSGGFVRSGANGTFLDLLTAITTSGDIPDRNKITDIVVQTAGNDWESTEENIRAALIAFMQYAKANYPYARVHVAVTSQFTTAPTASSIGVKYTVIPALQKMSYCNGYHYITNSEYIMITLDTIDGVHPDGANSEKLAGYLYSGVIGGSVSASKRYSVDITPALSGGNLFNVTLEMKNNTTCIFNAGGVSGSPALVVFNDSVKPMTGYSYFNGVKIGSVPVTFIRPFSAPAVAVFLWMHTTAGETLAVPALLCFSHNTQTNTVDLLLQTSYFKPDGSSPSFDLIRMSKYYLSGVTEWLL